MRHVSNTNTSLNTNTFEKYLIHSNTNTLVLDPMRVSRSDYND